MSLSLSQIFPGIETGLNKIGFLFGAGTSKEAGYPLMPELTKGVVSNLGTHNRETLDGIISIENINYEEEAGEPNIEILSDLVTEYFVRTQDQKFRSLEDAIRELIVENIISVSEPDLTYHISFLESLKKRAYGTSSVVTIFTTNYDILFELAAGEVGVRIETGFDGALKRQFDPTVFDLSRGTIEKNRFSNRSELCVNIIKLHGSIAWRTNGNLVTESGIDLNSMTVPRAMVLPRRRKVIETLSEPFDQLFTRASRILGTKCKYLVSCGFSFGDKHINDQLLFPKLRTGDIRLVALCGIEPDCITQLKAFPSFHAGFPCNSFIDQQDKASGTDLWKFSELAKLIAP